MTNYHNQFDSFLRKPLLRPDCPQGREALPTQGTFFMVAGLSERQVKVLDLTLKGFSKKQIAVFLHVSPRTITNDRKAIRIALRPHINIDSLQEELLRIFHEFDLNWRKTNTILHNSTNDYVKLRAIRLQLKHVDKKIEMIRTLGFVTTPYEKSFWGKQKQP